MSTTTLYSQAGHSNVLIEESEHQKHDTLAVQSNQHLIIDGDSAIILDPGGHKIYSKVLSDTMASLRGGAQLKYILLSHQDPDIVAAINGWLMTTDAEAYCSALWTRFVPHFGLDRLVADRLHPIGDEGMVFDLGSCELLILPAHFLHSCGNFQVYDPVSKILYTGDLGASLGMPYDVVPDLASHMQYTEGFHRRYMTSRVAMAAWANMVRPLEIKMIAPQHGARIVGETMCAEFIDWCADLECGVDLIVNKFVLPTRG